MAHAIVARIARWLAYRETLFALRKLDPWLRADLGLDDMAISTIAWRAVDHDGPVNLYRLSQLEAEHTKPVKAQAAAPTRDCLPLTTSARPAC